MAITVVGSVAFDSIETPAGRRERCLGGAATYFSLAASYFTSVRVIAVVASDGNVKKVEPVGGSPLLVQAAENAIAQWKYAPGGETRETVELHFTP